MALGNIVLMAQSSFADLLGRPNVETQRVLSASEGSGAAYVSLFRSEDFIEGRKAEAENRPPVFHGQ
jgi:hypothetical protein